MTATRSRIRRENKRGDLEPQKPSPKGAGRFYDAAWAEAGETGWQVLLDGRAVNTPLRARLTLPTAPLAEAVAAEWQAQEADIASR